MPKDNPPRWITLRKVPYDYKWPGRNAVTNFKNAGEYLVKAELADDAVAKGHATEGKADGSEAKAFKGKRIRKPKKATTPAKPATPKADAGPDKGQSAGMGGTDLAADDSASAGQSVAPAAE
jgi:hypothetical protein